MELFVQGRKNVIQEILRNISPADKSFWFHCASLGEFEQGVPIIEEIKRLYPQYKIVISFFSPSGYEIKKNTPLADVVVYLPMDTSSNAKEFVTALHPSAAFFIKYEFWPNYLFELKKNDIPTLLISGVFKKDQIFFKGYGGFMRKALAAFDHFFVQNKESEDLLREIGYQNVSISGDTRFDRVSSQLETDNHLQFVEDFKNHKLCIVCGSTWPEDESLLIDFINISTEDIKFIIAPHKIEPDKINLLRDKIQKKTILHSEKEEVSISDYSVLVIDCIGLLSRIYSYADIAYVGGAAGKTGLHNILEPATFGIPVVTGKNITGFPEAQKLKNIAGLFTVETSTETQQILGKLASDKTFRKQTGMISGHFVNNSTGATEKIITYINAHFS